MKKVLILDAGCKIFGEGGSLNHFFTSVMKEELEKLGFAVSVTKVEDPYVPEEEPRKIAGSDFVILQMPGWWMSAPWQYKKYEDEVFGHELICGGDGRSRHDATKLYGTGGKCVNAYYMVSSTWNAPLEAFNDPKQFFEGAGIDGALMGIHKPFQFIGMRKLPSFIANDVIKNPQIEKDTERLRLHIKDVFGPLV